MGFAVPKMTGIESTMWAMDDAGRSQALDELGIDPGHRAGLARCQVRRNSLAR